MLVVVKHQASTQLPSGKYWALDDKIKKIAKNVPKMNHDGECNMAVLDVLIRDKSFISSANLETTIM